jgi:hypothetical protein
VRLVLRETFWEVYILEVGSLNVGGFLVMSATSPHAERTARGIKESEDHTAEISPARVKVIDNPNQ